MLVPSCVQYPIWQSKTGSTNNVPIVTDTDVVPKLKWRTSQGTYT